MRNNLKNSLHYQHRASVLFQIFLIQGITLLVTFFPLSVLAQEQVVFTPGVIITSAVEKGDVTGNDYEFIVTIAQLDSTSFTYNWTMSAPKNWKGKRVVRAVDLEDAHMLNDVYYNSYIRSLSADYSSVVWPRMVFAKLKKGESVTIKIMELDKAVTRVLKMTGTESFSVIVNEVPRNLQSINCQSQDGVTYTILDDEKFPLGLALKRTGKVDGKVGWGAQVTSIRTPVTATAKTEKDILAETGRLTAYGIHFHTDSAELRPESEPIFVEVIAFLRSHPKETLVIEGHTDGIGSDEHNLDLSKRRAESVQQRLVAGGVDIGRLSTKAYGESMPVGDNQTLAGRALNRRVVFVVNR